MTRPSTRYPMALIALHWLTAAAVLLAFVTGGNPAEARGALEQLAAQAHVTSGMLVFALVALRLPLRALLGTPAAEPGPRWQHLAAKAAHVGLYALMLIVPLAGWSALAGETAAFSLLGFALPLPNAHATWVQLLGETHETLGNVFIWRPALCGLFHARSSGCSMTGSRTMHSLQAHSTEALLNKVPEITLTFWVIKVLATTVGETAADFLNFNLGIGLTNTSWLMAALFAVALVAQMRTRQLSQSLYWLVVVLVSVVGTLVTDNLVDNFGVSLTLLTPVFAVALLATFGIWFAREKTLSMHHIDTTSREGWYWLAILLTFALGTAAGDLVAETMQLGYLNSTLLFAAAIGLVAIARYGFKLGAVAAFWAVRFWRWWFFSGCVGECGRRDAQGARMAKPGWCQGWVCSGLKRKRLRVAGIDPKRKVAGLKSRRSTFEFTSLRGFSRRSGGMTGLGLGCSGDSPSFWSANLKDNDLPILPSRCKPLTCQIEGDSRYFTASAPFANHLVRIDVPDPNQSIIRGTSDQASVIT
ncbi:MAG: hypothetical protein B7X81_05395 [Hydrogenophilales bacterium 17-61-76]|nr:MAG: hypothetical protein B7X81_05395 [Hydrogenophilales bacterium 17-61-76]